MMHIADFKIGMEFECAGRRYRCTDVGSRTAVGIRVDQVEKTSTNAQGTTTTTLNEVEAEAEGWFNGPPYAVAEVVFDEDDREICEPCT